MEKITRRKFLQALGIGVATAATSALSCEECSAEPYASKMINGQVTRTRCPHRFCKRYQGPEGGINEDGYSLYTAEEGYCLSRAFKGLPRL